MNDLDKVALITVMYDYPEWQQPIWLNNAKKFFKEENIHIPRYNQLKPELSYYQKFLFYKGEKIRDYIEEHLLGVYDYVLFLDATDTNFYRDPADIVSTFKQFNKSIVFCGEKFLWPPTEFNHLYEQKPKITDARYLNAGIWMGYIDKVHEYLSKMVENPAVQDDQGCWSVLYLHNEDIEVDQERKLFFSTLNSKNNVQLTDSKVELIDINPYIIHDNGPYNDDTIKIAEKLNDV